MRVLITGASGSGTSTLGKAIAQAWNAQLFDADDYFWVPSDPPYKEKRAREDRLAKIVNELEGCERAVVAGSVMSWGASLEHSFALAVFLHVPTTVRLERIEHRELARFGQVNSEFLEWASQYDEDPPEGRSLAKHNAWLATLRCPIIRLVGKLSQSEQLVAIAKTLPNPAVEWADLQAALANSLATLGHSSLPR